MYMYNMYMYNTYTCKMYRYMYMWSMYMYRIWFVHYMQLCKRTNMRCVYGCVSVYELARAYACVYEFASMYVYAYMSRCIRNEMMHSTMDAA